METEEREDYAYILDFLVHGVSTKDKRAPSGPVAYGVGETRFKLFELIPKSKISLTAGERIYIGSSVELRKEILQVRRRIRYVQLTNAAQNELPFIIATIVKNNEERFVKFFNEAQAISIRYHMLELLPGLGKKTMIDIIEDRKKGRFKSFEDISKRINISNPEKFIIKRIQLEIMEPHQKYHLFVAK